MLIAEWGGEYSALEHRGKNTDNENDWSDIDWSHCKWIYSRCRLDLDLLVRQ